MTTARIAWAPDRAVTATVEGKGSPAVVLAHGAGTDQHHPLIATLRSRLAAGGVTAATFDYPFTAEGRRRPDPAPTLLSCHRAVLAWARESLPPGLVAGGRSMGGRIATMLAAAGEPVDGLALFAYPLHPAGKPDRLRVDHLPSVECPMLFFQAGRDALSRADLFDRHVRPLPGVTVVDLPGADHSFRGRGLDPDAMASRLAAETLAWIRRLAPFSGAGA